MQDGNRIVAVVRDHNIWFAVAVNVGHGEVPGTNACPILHLRLKGPVAIALQDGNRIVAVVRDHNIWLAVAVDIGRMDYKGG